MLALFVGTIHFFEMMKSIFSRRVGIWKYRWAFFSEIRNVKMLLDKCFVGVSKPKRTVQNRNFWNASTADSFFVSARDVKFFLDTRKPVGCGSADYFEDECP